MSDQLLALVICLGGGITLAAGHGLAHWIERRRWRR